nr:protein PRRC2A-like [Anolis sagrei ordinatus]
MYTPPPHPFSCSYQKIPFDQRSCILYSSHPDSCFLDKNQLLHSNSGPLKDSSTLSSFPAKQRERPRKQDLLPQESLAFPSGPGFSAPKEEAPGEPRSRSVPVSEGLAPQIWNQLNSNASRKSYRPASVEPWIDPLNAFEEVASTEMSLSDSGVDLSSDSQVSSATCSQRSSPDGGLKATPDTGNKHSGAIGTGSSDTTVATGPEGAEPKEQRRRPPPSRDSSLLKEKVQSRVGPKSLLTKRFVVFEWPFPLRVVCERCT